MSETTNNEMKNYNSQGAEGSRFLRFRLAYRIEHWIFITSFLILGLTGLVQKFPENNFSQWVVTTLGGIENTRTIHHTAAIIMMFVVIYHIGALTYRMYVLRYRPSMLPWIDDVKAAFGWVSYNLGFSKTKPQEGRYSFAEKLEYWAVVWGTVVMAVTGYMMWNPISTTRFLPGNFVPAAKVAHGLEAILAIAAIFVWHFYYVFIRNFNRSMFTGYIDVEEMLEDHPLEYADIKAGTDIVPIDPESLKRRKLIFWPTYSIIAVVMLVGVYLFVNYEETAITTIPPAERVEVFVPLTPTPLPTPLPTSTPAPVATTLTWEGGIGDLFQSRCETCHNSVNALGDLDLSDYQSALQGGNSGPGIVPGDPDTSQIVIIQSAGGHPGQLTNDELESVIIWVNEGAPEN